MAKTKSKQTETTTRVDEITAYASTPQVIDDDEILDGDESLDDDDDNDGDGDDEPTGNYLTPTDGTVSITGNLMVDLLINGNLTVSGQIYSNVKATGSITYGTLSGTVDENAELETCDIQVDGGTLTFASVVNEFSGAIYTEGQVTNASGTTTTLYDRMIIDGTVNNQLYNNGGTFIVGDGGVLDVTSSIASGNRVIYNTAGTFTVDVGGEVVSTASGAAHGIYSEATGTINCYGKITTTSSASYDGLVLLGPCNIKDGGVLIATGARYGVYNYSNSAANFTIESGGKATLTGGTYGLYAAVGSTNISGKLSVEATASGSYGIYNTATFNTEAGSEVETVGVTYGIRNTSTINIGGKFRAEGTDETSGVGIYVSGGTLNINEDAKIDAVGNLYGLQSTVVVNNYGSLQASGGTTDFYCSGTSNFASFASYDYVPIEETVEPIKMRSYAANAAEDEDTFYLPDLRERFPEGAGSSHPLGTSVYAGLPEVYGASTNNMYALSQSTGQDGVFKMEYKGTANNSTGSAARGFYKIYICASDYNSIYSRSLTVQPAALAMHFIIKT